MRLSLRGRLRWMIIAVLIAVLLPLGLYSYHRALKETRELLDGRLAQSAQARLASHTWDNRAARILGFLRTGF